MSLVTFPLILVTAQAASASTALPPSPLRTDLQRHDLSAPGWETIQTRVDFPAGSIAAKHKHPGEEIIYVLKGRLEYRRDGQLPITLGPGEVLFVPYGKPHAAVNVGQGAATELATYVVEKGKPLVVPVP
jgi:quercetin dioxygenase-like cupin family protein